MTPHSPADAVSGIRARVEAATRGPWAWTVNLHAREMRLEGRTGGNETVMGCERWGMQNARLVVRDLEESGYNGRLASADDFATPIPGREHHARWCQTIAHPDLDLIAHAPTDLAFLLAEVERLQTDRDAAREERNAYEARMHAVCKLQRYDVDNAGREWEFEHGHYLVWHEVNDVLDGAA